MQQTPVTATDSLLPASLEEPHIRIRPQHTSVRSQLKDSWARRELLYFLIWRDLKVRYRQTLLGASWVILQPLLSTIVFTVFMSRLVGVPSDGVPYPLFVYAGLLPWMFFSNSVSAASYGLLGNSSIITKVYFPRLILMAAMVGVRLVDFLVASLVLIALMFAYGIGVTRNIGMLPLLVVQLALFAFAISVWLAVLNIKYRDVGTALPVLMQLWMFVSPIVYPSSLIPAEWRWLYFLNPIAAIVEGFRAALFGLPFNSRFLFVSALITLVSVVGCVYLFCRSEERLVDVL